MTYYYSHSKSPVGTLHMISKFSQFNKSSKLIALIFDSNWEEFTTFFDFKLLREKDEIIIKTEKQLKEYFSGSRKSFDIPIEFSGTEFQKLAWKTLQQIPFGQTISYGQQALKMKNPKAVRAVGGANSKNNICIIVPCHRVIGKNGHLTGFAGGIGLKEQLLKHESSV